MTFKLNLSEELKKQIEDERQEAMRLYSLPDRWLARELLRMSRVLRSISPSFGPSDYVYDATMFWHLVPEVAFRLGETRFVQYEREDWDIRKMSNLELRSRAAMSWVNCSSMVYWKAKEGRLFFREICNGSPFSYALDRLADPGDDDVFRKRLVEVARNRKVETTGTWTPAMLAF